MRVSEPRWGEVIIRKQGDDGKNSFDKSKSFSIDNSPNTNYNIEEYREILKTVTMLTETFKYSELKERLLRIK
jgi:hypothetical protein